MLPGPLYVFANASVCPDSRQERAWLASRIVTYAYRSPIPKFPPEANIYTVDCVRVPMCVCGCGCGWMAARRDVSLLQIAKALGLECTAMINANRKKFPSLRAGTKFQAGTTLALPQEGDAMEE